MATPRLFKLKSQIIAVPQGPSAHFLPVASVWVDTGVFHLDQPYDYEIPQRLSNLVNIGVKVAVPFGNREVEGIVITRKKNSDSATKLKAITKVSSARPVATKDSLELCAKVAERWGSPTWDVIRSAIPPRVSGVEKDFVDRREFMQEKGKNGKIFAFHALAPHIDPALQIASLAIENLSKGSILIVAPDARDVTNIIAGLRNLKVEIPVYRLDSVLSRSHRYVNYLHCFENGMKIVVGSRSAIFAPVKNLSTIIIFKESSPQHYEIRSPAWNCRDVAIMRRSAEGVDLILSGYVPSIEVTQLIETKVITYRNTNARINVKAIDPGESGLLPSRLFSEVRKALDRGPVLFIVPTKGYGNALLCAHCKNTAQCECGGRLVVSAKGADPSCVLCPKSYPQWKCAWCAREKQFLASRGIDRASEEIGRAFANFPVIKSSGENILDSVANRPSLVLATPGAAPLTVGGYSAVVILEGLRFFSHSDLRADERAREYFFQSAALVSPSGDVLIVIDGAHPIIAALVKWNPANILKRELRSLAEVELSPFVASVLLKVNTREAISIANGLRTATTQGRIPTSIKILGPTAIDANDSKIVVNCDPNDCLATVAFLHELQRRRSISKKNLLVIRVAPYSLS